MNFRSKLLNQSQIAKCTQLAGKDDQNGKRAKALLALHNGSTLKKASDISGLTHGQVRYILGRFRKIGIGSLAVETVLGKVTTTKTKAILVDDKKNEKEKSPKIRTKARSKKKKKKKVKEAKPRKSKKRKKKDKEKRKEKLKMKIMKEKEKKKKDKKNKRKKKK